MRVAIRPFSATDYAALAALHNATFPEFSMPEAELRLEDDIRPARCRSARWVAEADGRVVGLSGYHQEPSMFDPRKFSLDVMVEPTLYGQGIGGQLWAVLLNALRDLDPLRVDTWSREDMPCRLGFLEHRGFRPDMRLWTSELSLRTFDARQFERPAARPAGIRIASLADLRATDPNTNEHLYDLWSTVRQDVPIAPGEVRQPVPFDEWLARQQRPSLLPHGYFVALDVDLYVGLTQLWATDEPGLLRTGLTAVRGEYRRRGIALALKLVSLSWAATAGYARVQTDNASTNAGMLAINDRLGFVRNPAWIHYAVDWSDLARVDGRTEAKAAPAGS
jgi:GNAT superfamily N-acetyltransferase